MVSVTSFETFYNACDFKHEMLVACAVRIEPVQSNPVNTDTEEAILGVRIKRVEFRENVGAFFPQGQSKLSVITRCPY